MLTWDNFKYVFVEDATIPWFPVTDEIKEDYSLEQVLDVIDKIASQPTGPADRPISPIRMKIITVK